MRVLGRDVLDKFRKKPEDVNDWINNWLEDVKQNKWQSPGDVKERYPSVSPLKNNVAIFNVKGNEYRLEVHIAYKTEIVKVLWAGTHAEYDRKNKKRGSQ